MSTPSHSHKPAAPHKSKNDADDDKTTLVQPAKKVPAPPSKSGLIEITASGFSPSEISVPVGTTVTFDNKDSVTHNVTFDAAPVISEDVKPGTAFFHTVTATGEHAYHDKNDAARKGVIKAS